MYLDLGLLHRPWKVMHLGPGQLIARKARIDAIPLGGPMLERAALGKKRRGDGPVSSPKSGRPVPAPA